MLSLLFGLGIFLGGIFATLFIDSFWGLIAASCFVHIAPYQVHIETLRPVFALSILVLCVYVLGGKYSNKFTSKPTELLLMVLMLFGMILSLYNSYDKQATWDSILTFFKFILFFLLLINIIDNRKKLLWWCNGLLLSAAWLVYRCWDLRGTTGARFENLGGAIVQDSNQFAAALVLMLPLAISRSMQQQVDWRVRVGAAIGAFGIIMSVIITTSRGSSLGMIACLVAMVVLAKEHRRKIITIFFVLALVATPFVPQYYIDRVAAVFSSEEVDQDASAQSRLASWTFAYDLWKEHPVVGVGMNNFGYYMGHYIDGKPWGERGHVAHSVWMQALGEGGLAVTLPFLGLLLLFFFRTWRAKRHCLDKAIFLDISSLQAGMIGFLVAATFVNRLFYEPLYWWCGMAFIHVKLLQADRVDI